MSLLIETDLTLRQYMLLQCLFPMGHQVAGLLKATSCVNGAQGRTRTTRGFSVRCSTNWATWATAGKYSCNTGR